MSLKPVQPEEQVQRAFQLGLTVLSSPETHIPGNLLDAIQSFKQLLGGVIQGNLFLCQNEEAKKEGEKLPEAPKDEAKVSPKEAVKTAKKVVKKKASKRPAAPEKTD